LSAALEKGAALVVFTIDFMRSVGMVPRLLSRRIFVRKLALLVVLVVSSAAFAATPSAGVPLQVRRGFFTETGVGAGFNLGGVDGYSNAALYLQLGIGYQLAILDGKGIIPIGLHVGFGSNAQDCWSERGAAPSDPQACVNPSEKTNSANRVVADNFTQTFIDLTAGYLHRFGDGYITSRFYGGAKLVGGIALLDPKPIPNGGLVYGNFGIVAALEFATMVDHFSVGLDVGYRFILGPNASALTFAGRVQYTF